MNKVVTINLKEDTFTPGKSYYERVRKCLETNFNEKFNIIVSWDPPEEKLCPSSIAAWFHSHQHNVSVCYQKFTTRIERSLPVPIIKENCDMNTFFEWIGIFSINGDIKNDNADDYINTYCCPSPNILANEILYIECTGLFTRSQIKKVSNRILNSLSNEQQSSPWASLHVHGFADSPVSWNLKEHTYFTAGDNSYTIIYLPNNDNIIQKSLNSNNKLRIVQ